MERLRHALNGGACGAVIGGTFLGLMAGDIKYAVGFLGVAVLLLALSQMLCCWME